MSFTPGPNNLMCAASGVNFGFWRTMPHVAGITVGFPLMLLGVGMGLGALITGHPVLALTLRYLGCAYLLFTAYQLARARTAKQVSGDAQPKHFLSAVAFQWINPKAWMMSVSSIGLFAGVSHDQMAQLMVMCAMLGGMALISAATWTAFGVAIARFLSDPRRLRVFNVSMAILLVGSIVPVFFH